MQVSWRKGLIFFWEKRNETRHNWWHFRSKMAANRTLSLSIDLERDNLEFVTGFNCNTVQTWHEIGAASSFDRGRGVRHHQHHKMHQNDGRRNLNWQTTCRIYERAAWMFWKKWNIYGRALGSYVRAPPVWQLRVVAIFFVFARSVARTQTHVSKFPHRRHTAEIELKQIIENQAVRALRNKVLNFKIENKFPFDVACFWRGSSSGENFRLTRRS